MTKTSLKAALLVGAVFAATPAFAQISTQPTADDQAASEQQPGQTEGDSIVVTGSRIQRPDLTGTSPVAVVDAEEFELSGAVNVEQVINTLPQVLPGLTGFSNNPGNGAVTLNLRGLGSTRTLVLVNGRRWMFYDTNQIVDLNTIPQFLISGVDVVTGGASAVYGSDAVAGVVNFRLKEVNGIEMGATYSLTERGDFPRYSLNMAIGTDFADNRGNVTLFANYTERKSLFAGARDFSRISATDGCIVPGSTGTVAELGTPLPTGIAVATCAARGGELGFVPGGSATGPIATFVAPNAAGAATTYIFNPTGGGSRVFQDPADLYNFAPVNYLGLPQERYLVGAYGSYEINDNIEVYSELSYVNNRVSQELAPTPTGVTVPLQIASPFFNDQTRALLLAQDAAETTPATRGDGYATTTVAYRFLSAGSRNSTQTRQAFRVLAGLRGDLTDSINYDAFYSYARTSNQQRQLGNVSSSRYQAALTTAFNAQGQLVCRSGLAGCIPINPFGENLANPAAVSFIDVASTNLEQSDLQNLVASISGSLFNLGFGADDIGFAFGGEYRKMSARYDPDEFLSSGDVLGFNAGQPTSGSYDVKEIFGELRVPILDSNGLLLELNGAARYSDYSLAAVGGVWTYTGGVVFAPVPDVRFRAQYARAVRAPNVQDLFGGQSVNFPGVIDPCSDRGSVASRTQALRDLCIASGVPAAAVFTRPVQPNAQIQVTQGGNPNVGEETSDTYTAGVVIQPSFIPRLSITADYFNIKVEDTIGVLAGGANTALALCYNTIQDLNNPICQVFAGTRGSTGAIGLTQGGQNPVFTSANVGLLETSGMDIQVDYNMPLFETGRLSFFYLGTLLEEFSSTTIAAIPERESFFEGTFGQPIYRHTSRLTYSDGPASVSLRWRFEGKTQSSRIRNVFNGITRVGTSPALISKPYLGEISYFDLTFNFDVTENFSFTAGVNNILDKQAPVLGTDAEQANTLPSYFDVLGRDYFVSAKLTF